MPSWNISVAAVVVVERRRPDLPRSALTMLDTLLWLQGLGGMVLLWCISKGQLIWTAAPAWNNALSHHLCVVSVNRPIRALSAPSIGPLFDRCCYRTLCPRTTSVPLFCNPIQQSSVCAEDEKGKAFFARFKIENAQFPKPNLTGYNRYRHSVSERNPSLPISLD